MYTRAKAGIAEENPTAGPEVIMPSNPLSPEKQAEVEELAQAIR